MIQKINFRDQVKELLLQKMRSGDLKPENPISLASLARDLNVSVTPIREALSQLQSSSIVKSIPNRGFFIPELSKEEALNLYELVVSLESLAIRNSIFKDECIENLKKLNLAFEKANNRIERINADMDFHETLTLNYKNTIALKILSDLKTRIFFYELEFMGKENYCTESRDQHKQIIQSIEDKNMDKTCEILEQNWLSIIDHLNL